MASLLGKVEYPPYRIAYFRAMGEAIAYDKESKPHLKKEGGEIPPQLRLRIQ